MRTLLLLMTLLFSASVAMAAPRVVVSIGPVHSLVAGVMEGVAEPTLLIPAGASPHAYALKPSDARALSRADLIIWVGEGLEAVLEQPLHSLGGDARVVELSTLEGVELLPGRKGGVWEREEEHAGEEGHDHGHGDMDTHLWLAPENARRIVAAAAGQLADLDAANAEHYRRNAAGMKSRIDALEMSIRTRLAPIQERPYIVFHDAYHYFEAAFELHPVGAIAVSPDRSPGARRLAQMRDLIRQRGAVCVFSEPQFRPDTVEVVLEGSGARHGVLDPLGAELKPGTGQWFALMQGLADSLSGCLGER